MAEEASVARSSAAGALRERLRGHSTLVHTGRVVRALGTSLRVSGLPVRIGQRCEIGDRHSGTRVLADVVGIEGGDAVLVPLSGLAGIAVDSAVRIVAEQASVGVDESLRGAVLDGFGQPIDGRAPCAGRRVPLLNEAPHPLRRRRVERTLETGVRAIDALLSVGEGQRLGIFAPAGVGKSTLLGMLAAHAEADVVVVGLIGERGREVREFLEDTLDEATRARTVIVVATSDRPAMERIGAAHTATALAEGFRDAGQRVLLLMDSVTRFARAVREVGLAVGEPPVRQGFTPSVFAELPRLFERSGPGLDGSITAFYTVLTDDDDGLDPVAEETRSILDGHIVLSRRLAERGRFPAIDVPASLSRLFATLAPPETRERAARLRALMAKHAEIEFLVQVGEYEAGSDALADEAIARRESIETFLRQSPAERATLAAAGEALAATLDAPASAGAPAASADGTGT